jgi:hypothetical protein
VAVFSISDKLLFIESVFGKGRLAGNGKNFDVRCPICAPSDVTKKKLAIKTDDDRCHCWVCGFKARNLVPLIRKYGTPGQLAKYKEVLGIADGGTGELVTGEKVEEQRLELPKDFCLLPLANPNDPDVKATWRYLFGRGLTEKDAWYFKFGISNEPRWKRRVIMPSFNFKGELNYFTARAIDKDRRPKYDNPEVDKNPVIFNEINIDWTKRLALVEGPFDLVKCPDNTTALLGSDLDERHELFNRILLNNTPVALALDGDMWDRKTPKIAKKLQEYDVDVQIVDVRPWGDPGSMSRAEFEIALKEARYLDWNDNFLIKLNRVISTSSLGM